MANDSFDTNIMRLLAAEMFFSVSLSVAREMFGKSYFELGLIEKTTVDQAAFQGVAANYQNITPEFLKGPSFEKQMGFQSPVQDKKSQ